MGFQPRRDHPYAWAARLPEAPEGETIDLRGLLGPSRPGRIEIEIGPGRGGFLFERLDADPDVRLIGLEIRLKWAARVDRRLGREGQHARARVFGEDAKAALKRLGPEGSVAAVHLNFPDPWWKKRHEKRLVMGDVLLAEIVRLLQDEGEFFVQTDVEERAEQYTKQIAAQSELVPAGDVPGDPALLHNPYGARSNREHRAIADGLPVHRFLYRRSPR